MRDKLIALLKQLSQQHPINDINAEMLAQSAQVSVEVVQKTLGSAQNYPALLAYEAPNITRERILAAAMSVFS
ncbi:MAG TPA: hypothetical protein PLJ88_10825, partial [Agitococcus sp.]|nr:hypothetical protein [Agitococcus sp.]